MKHEWCLVFWLRPYTVHGTILLHMLMCMLIVSQGPRTWIIFRHIMKCNHGIKISLSNPSHFYSCFAYPLKDASLVNNLCNCGIFACLLYVNISISVELWKIQLLSFGNAILRKVSAMIMMHFFASSYSSVYHYVKQQKVSDSPLKLKFFHDKEVNKMTSLQESKIPLCKIPSVGTENWNVRSVSRNSCPAQGGSEGGSQSVCGRLCFFCPNEAWSLTLVGLVLNGLRHPTTDTQPLIIATETVNI